MTERLVLAADHVFDGAALHGDMAVVIAGEQIVGIGPRGQFVGEGRRVDLPPGMWLTPGFIDLQVNGGGDVLFNDEPSPAAIATIGAAHRKFGTTSFLPTLITDSDDKMRQAAAAVDALIGKEPGVLGIHFEGPFLSPEKPGVHPRRFIRRPASHHMQILHALTGTATTLVTLAPEEVPDGFISELVAAGVRVSLGHSMATYAQTKQAIAEGLTGFTHLFNAMRPLESREPGPIAAALETPCVWAGLIVDGEHVAAPTLRMALRLLKHPMLVTDAMPPTGGTRDAFALFGEQIRVQKGRCVTAQGRLAGAFLDMASAVRNCVRMLDVPLVDALRFASLEPARFLGLDHRLGLIAKGYRADLIALDPVSITVAATWVAGRKQ